MDNKKEIEEILQLYHPDRWEIDGYNIIIHYPKLVLKNTKREHTIYDLYVKIQVSTCINSISGLRTSHTFSEVFSGFSHPFLPGINANFESFCLGSTQISNDYRNDKLTPELFESFLIDFEAYLIYAKSVSSPYRKIDNINKSSGTVLEWEYRDAKNAIKLFKEKVDLKKLRVKITDAATIVEDSYFNTLMEECIELKGYNVEDVCYSNLHLSEDKVVDANSNFFFKGVEIPLVTFSDEDKNDTIIEKTAHLHLKKELINRINRLLTNNLKGLIKYEYIKRKKSVTIM